MEFVPQSGVNVPWFTRLVLAVTIIFLVISVKSSDVDFRWSRHPSARDDLRGEVRRSGEAGNTATLWAGDQRERSVGSSGMFTWRNGECRVIAGS